MTSRYGPHRKRCSSVPVSLWCWCLKLKLSWDLRPVGQPVLVSGSHLEPMTRFFSIWQLRVCNLLLELLLELARAITLRSKSRTTQTILYCLLWDSPKLGGSGPRIYVLQEQGGPVIHPGTGFPFRRLLRLAGLMCNYSNPPPHGCVGVCWGLHMINTQPLSSNDRCLQRYYVATAVV
jgi:hypothetical protein